MESNTLAVLQTTGASLLLKGGFLAILVLFELFLFVLHKQIRSMNTIITQPDMFPYLQTFAIFLEIAVVVLIIVTLVVL